MIAGGVKIQPIRCGHIIFTSNILCSQRQLMAQLAVGFPKFSRAVTALFSKAIQCNSGLKREPQTLVFLNLHLSFTSPEMSWRSHEMHAVLSVDGSFQEQDLESRMRILEGNLELCLQKKNPVFWESKRIWFGSLT